MLKNLCELFLKPTNPDEGHFKLVWEIKRLGHMGTDVDIENVQRMAYGVNYEQ